MQDRQKRKSLGFFKPSVPTLTTGRDGTGTTTGPEHTGRASVLKKKIRPSSLIFFPSSTSSPLPLKRVDSNGSQQSIPSPVLKGRPTSRPSRPSSIFGSIKSIHSLQSLPDDDASLGHSTSRSSWGTTTEAMPMLDIERMVLLEHGEATIGSGMFKKKNQYLVLTNTHLIRFRSQARASELFPGLSPPSSSSGNETPAHIRKPSSSSGVDVSSEDLSNIAVRQIVAVCKIEDGKGESKSQVTLEVTHLDESNNSASTMVIQLSDSVDAVRWLRSLGSAALQVRSSSGCPLHSRKVVEYVARTLESDFDYDPEHFHMYTVVQREKKSSFRGSSDDLGKLLSNVSYLAIGYHKLHLVPLLRQSRSSSSTSISDMAGTSFGITAITSVDVSPQDDSLHISFRLPLQGTTSLSLASSCSNEIVSSLREAIEFLRPLYIEQPLSWLPSSEYAHSKFSTKISTESEDHLGFDRTLTAYCVAYKLDPSNIRYSVNYFGEDVPEFRLLGPANGDTKPDYTALELLAIFRALRYNDSFNSISFSGVKLDALQGVVDRLGSEHLSWKNKTGQALDRPHATRLSLLVQEVQDIAVQNERLRRIDFSDCLSSTRNDTRYIERGSTEIVEALMPLCSERLTNIDWIKLNGLALSELDVSSLYTATLKRSCEFRAIELGGCAVGFEGLRIVAEGMQYQAKTIECVNLSGCTAKLDENVVTSLANFGHVRLLDLSRCQPAVSNVPFVPYNVLSSWRLESLKLSGTPLSPQSVDDLAAYLMDNQSSNLREVLLDCCQVSGREIAVLLHALSYGREEPRKMLLDVSRNRIAQDQHAKIVHHIGKSETPDHLIMKFLEYTREEDFQALLLSVARNQRLKFLDISSVSLPFDASGETCDALRTLFEANDTLEELNISGEVAALEAATIGKGLPGALKGLSANRSLRVLRCRHQGLGLPGAAALAGVIESNDTLREIHCEDNDISLQAFTALVNALEYNKSLLYLPSMDTDRKRMTDKVNREVNAILSSKSGSASMSSGKSSLSIRRSVTGLASYRPHAALRTSSTRSVGSKSSERSTSSNGSSSVPSIASLSGAGITEQDLTDAISKVDDSWDAETARLQSYLYRNICLAQGYGPDGSVPEDFEGEVLAARIPMTAAEAGFVLPPVAELSEGSRPPTAGSLAAAIAKASLDRTPTAEFDRQLDVTPTKVAIETSVYEKPESPARAGEGLLIEPSIQDEFGQMFGLGDESDSFLLMAAK